MKIMILVLMASIFNLNFLCFYCCQYNYRKTEYVFSATTEDLQKSELHELAIVTGCVIWKIGSEHKDWMLPIEDIEEVVDICYRKNLKESYRRIFLADTIDYYSKKE